MFFRTLCALILQREISRIGPIKRNPPSHFTLLRTPYSELTIVNDSLLGTLRQEKFGRNYWTVAKIPCRLP